MANLSPNHGRQDADAARSDVRLLLRSLVEKAESGSLAARAAIDDSSRRVLIDLEMGGVRYVLIRVAPEVIHHHSLSPREREITRMVALGYPNKTIAAALDISSWTVGTYLRRIFAKLKVTSRAAMVAQVMGEVLTPEPVDVRDADHQNLPVGDRAPVPVRAVERRTGMRVP